MKILLKFCGVALSSVVLNGCLFAQTSYENFIEVMNCYVKMEVTIDKEDYNPAYPNGRYIADSRYLKKKITLDNNVYQYSYARPNIFGRFCHYSLFVDHSTMVIVGWKFDSDISDPKKNCGISGSFII